MSTFAKRGKGYILTLEFIFNFHINFLTFDMIAGILPTLFKIVTYKKIIFFRVLALRGGGPSHFLGGILVFIVYIDRAALSHHFKPRIKKIGPVSKITAS